MGLSNAEYEKILRIYDERRARAREELAERTERALEMIPALRGIQEALADIPAARARALLAGDTAAAERYAKQLADVRETRGALLEGAGLPADWLEMRYTCPICHDTGFVDGRECSCLSQLIVEQIFESSAIRDRLAQENFRTFTFDYFDRDVKDPATGLTSLDNMQRNFDIAKRMAYNFEPGLYNLLFIGAAGTGKTFLSNCIAEEVMRQGRSVVYLSAGGLFERLADHAFRDRDDDSYRYILECDLLIIDDLGTEVNNSFVSSQLFYCLNERILRRRSTIISTNLDLNRIRDIYSERVSSRLLENYTICTFFNRDIRLIRRREKIERSR